MAAVSRSRSMAMIGFCTAPSRHSAIDSTSASRQVGSCQLTVDPAPIPSSESPAARAPRVRVAELLGRERAAEVVGRAAHGRGVVSARPSTDAQKLSGYVVVESSIASANHVRDRLGG